MDGSEFESVFRAKSAKGFEVLYVEDQFDG